MGKSSPKLVSGVAFPLAVSKVVGCDGGPKFDLITVLGNPACTEESTSPKHLEAPESMIKVIS